MLILCIDFGSERMLTKFLPEFPARRKGQPEEYLSASCFSSTRSLSRFYGYCAVKILTVLLILLGIYLYEITIYDHHL